MSGFQLSVESLPVFLVFVLRRSVIEYLEISRHFFNQKETKPKNQSCLLARIFPPLVIGTDYMLVFDSRSDWFIELFMSVVIGQRN